MVKKYNWEQLRGDYVRGDIESVQDFLKSKEIPYTGHVANQVVGWPTEREAYQRQLQDEIADKTIQSVSETEAQVRARQAKAARFLQHKAITALQTQVPENSMQSLKMLNAGLYQEREAMNLNKQSPIVAGNINIAILNTRYGKALQSMSYDELQGVLKRLSELNAKGAGGTEPSGGVPASTVEGEIVSE